MTVRRVTEREGRAGEETKMHKEVLSVLSKPSCTINKGESACRAEIKERETYVDGWEEKMKAASDRRHTDTEIEASGDEQHVALEIKGKETAPYENQARNQARDKDRWPSKQEQDINSPNTENYA